MYQPLKDPLPPPIHAPDPAISPQHLLVRLDLFRLSHPPLLLHPSSLQIPLKAVPFFLKTTILLRKLTLQQPQLTHRFLETRLLALRPPQQIQ